MSDALRAQQDLRRNARVVDNAVSEAALSPESREADPDLIRRYRRLAKAAGIAVVAIGVAGLIGWFGGVPLLTSLRADWATMKANTSVGLVASGSALVLHLSGRRATHRVARLCAGFVTVLGAASLAEYVSGWNFGIDQLLVGERPGAIATTNPGRMAIVTAVNLVLCGLALLQLDTQTRRWAWLSSVLALPVWAISAVAALGYAFGAQELYSFAGKITAIAAPTATAFVLLATGIIFVGIEAGVLHWLASPRSGGVMLRRLLPLGILLPAMIVWLRLVGQAGGMFISIEFGAATVAVAMMVSVSCALLWCAAVLDRLDRERLSGEARIRRLNALLRQRVGVLEVANKELEGFSYSTSHVLRTPLRAIDGFCQILLEDYSDRLDDEGKRLLGVVRSSAQEMAELIDGILGFLRLGRDPMSVGLIDMSVSVRTALEELEPKTRGRRLKIDGPQQLCREIAAELPGVGAWRAAVRAQHAASVDAHDGGPHPQLYMLARGGHRRVRPDGGAAAGLERLEQAALGGHRGQARPVAHRREQCRQLGLIVPALHGEGALAGGREHLVRLENLRDGVGVADPGQAGVGQHHPVELAVAHLAQPGVGVAADRDAAQVGAEPEQLRGPPRRAGADPRAGGEIGELGAVPRDERVPRVITGRHRGQHDARRGPGRQVLQRVHGQVHPAAEQRVAQRADEHASATDLGQLGPADVAERRHPDDLDLAAGPLGDHLSHLAGLRHGHRAPAAAEP